MSRGVLIILVFSATLWIWWGQSLRRPETLAIDLVGLAIGVAVTSAVRKHLRRREATILALLAGVLVAWLVVSMLDPWARQTITKPSRAATVGLPTRMISQGWPSRRVAVALSGGGYRAAVYHAGLLNALKRLGVTVTHISSVSGGSIIGAYYSQGGDPITFRDAVAMGSLNLRRRIGLAQNVLRLPLTGFSRSSVQAEMLREFLRERAYACPECPMLLIAATDLNFGFQVGLLPEGILLVDEAEQSREFYPEVKSLGQFDLARRISISGAFPGPFPQERIDVDVRRRTGLGYEPAQPFVRRTLVLADGGIADNTGLSLLRMAQEMSDPADVYHDVFPDWRVEKIIVSDASAIFGLGGTIGGLNAVARTVDVIAARSSRNAQKTRQLEPDLVWIGPHRTFLSPPKLFSAQLERLDDAGMADLEIGGWFNPLAYPDNVLRAAVDELPKTLLPAVEAALRDFSALRQQHFAFPPQLSNRDSRMTLNKLNRVISRSRSVEECRQQTLREFDGSVELSEMACAAVILRLGVLAEIERLCIVFRSTPTLDDQLRSSTVHDLFALGTLQTLLEWPRLKLLLTELPIDETANNVDGGMTP